MALPLILGSLAAGGAGAIWANQQKDPNRDMYKRARQRAGAKAKELRMRGERDIGGAMTGNIRNAAQTQIDAIKTGGVATGRGMDANVMRQATAVAKDAGSAENKARRYGMERTDRLKDEASDVVSDTEAEIDARASAFKEAKRQAVINSMMSGAAGAVQLGMSGIGQKGQEITPGGTPGSGFGLPTQQLPTSPGNGFDSSGLNFYQKILEARKRANSQMMPDASPGYNFG